MRTLSFTVSVVATLLLSMSLMQAEASLFKFEIHPRGKDTKPAHDNSTDNNHGHKNDNNTQPADNKNHTEPNNHTVPSNHSHDGPIDDNDDHDNSQDYTDGKTEYYLNGIRGFWTGYMRGFYKDSKYALNERCLSINLSKNLHFLVDFVEGNQPIYKVVSFVTTFAKVFNDNNENCGYQKFALDMKEFCAKDEERCTLPVLSKHLTDKMFSLIGEINGIIAAVQSFPPEDKDDMYLDALEIGLDLGKVIRDVYDYK